MKTTSPLLLKNYKLSSTHVKSGTIKIQKYSHLYSQRISSNTKVKSASEVQTDMTHTVANCNFHTRTGYCFPWQGPMCLSRFHTECLTLSLKLPKHTP